MSVKTTPKISGRLVVMALEDLQEPASAFTVTTYLGALLGVNPNKIFKTILDILEGGQLHGFVAKHNNHYYIPKPSVVKELYKAKLVVNGDS